MSGFPFSTETSIPSASVRLNQFVHVVRTFMRDFPELNRLIAGEETSSRMIAWAVVDALDDWNSTPPLIGSYSLDNFPSMSWLREATVLRLLESVGLLQTRNYLPFSDGGISIEASPRANLLMSWVRLYEARTERKKLMLKNSINIELAMDGSGVASEYFLVAGHYLR